MDNNNMNDDLENKDPKYEDNSSDDDIPLWLQGLVSNDQDDQGSNASEEDNEDSWLPELSDELEFSEDEQGFKEANDVEHPMEAMNKSNHQQSDHENELNQRKDKEEIDIDRLPNGSYSNDIGPTIDDLPSSEGFMEISDMETTEFSIKNEAALEDEPLIEGELPEWLQEMIAEQEQPKETDFNDEVIEKHDHVEENNTDLEPKLQKSSFDEDDYQDEDYFVFNDELDEEEAFLVDIDSSNKPAQELDSGWLLEQDEPVEEEKVMGEESVISEEISTGIDDIAAYEMAEYETQPVNVSTDDQEPLSSTLDEPSIEDTSQKADELHLSDSVDEPLAEDSAADEHEYFSPWVEDSSRNEPFGQVNEERIDKEPDDPFIEAYLPKEDKEIPLPMIEDSTKQRTIDKEKEDDQETDQDEPTFDHLYSIEDEKESLPTIEEPFFDDPFSDEEEFSSPPFGVPYEQEKITADQEIDSLSSSDKKSTEEDLTSTFEETFEQDTFTIDEEDEELPGIDESTFEKHDEFGYEEISPSEETQIDKNDDIPQSLEESLIEELLASEHEEDPLASHEEIQINETFLDDNDDALEGIKHLIEQGNFKSVIPKINDRIINPNHLDKLELWIREATESPLEPKSELWETLGDINIKQNKPEQALNAYAKAIKHLLAK